MKKTLTTLIVIIALSLIVSFINRPSAAQWVCDPNGDGTESTPTPTPGPECFVDVYTFDEVVPDPSCGNTDHPDGYRIDVYEVRQLICDDEVVEETITLQSSFCLPV
jgi:hypothetical protein